MEYVKGDDLWHLDQQQRMSEKPLSEESLKVILRDALMALVHVHSIGMAHRDVKSTNIMVSADGHAKLTDFGLATYINKPPDWVGDTDYNAWRALHLFTHGYDPCMSDQGLVLEPNAIQAADVYAFASMIRQVFTGESAENAEMSIDIPNTVPRLVRNLISTMTVPPCPNSEYGYGVERSTAEKALTHAWFHESGHQENQDEPLRVPSVVRSAKPVASAPSLMTTGQSGRNPFNKAENLMLDKDPRSMGRELPEAAFVQPDDSSGPRIERPNGQRVNLRRRIRSVGLAPGARTSSLLNAPTAAQRLVSFKDPPPEGARPRPRAVGATTGTALGTEWRASKKHGQVPGVAR